MMIGYPNIAFAGAAVATVAFVAAVILAHQPKPEKHIYTEDARDFITIQLRNKGNENTR